MRSSESPVALFRELLPLVPGTEKRRFVLLLCLSVGMALSELFLTGLVALLAAIFGSPEAVYNNNPVLWLREHLGIGFGDDPRLLAFAALCVIFLAIVAKNIMNVVEQRQLALFSESVGNAARLRVFRFYQRAPYLWVLNTGVADLNFGQTAAAKLSIFLFTFLNFLSGFFMVVTLFIGLICVSPLPSLMFLVVLGLGGALLVRGIRDYQDRCANAAFAVERQVNKVGHLALHGLKEMRLYRRENVLFDAYSEEMGKVVKARARLMTLSRLPVAGLESLGFLTLVGVMLFLVFVQDAGMARISGIMGFMAAAAWRALPVANRMVQYFALLRSELPYLRKTLEVVRLEQTLEGELLPLDSAAPPLAFADQVVFDEVSFRYPDASGDAVHGVSLSIRSGSMIGIVGLSGSGKSTLVNLLTGLLSPSSGRILVDGVPVTRENTAAWLRHIGYVSQSPYILDASLAENVALSRWGEPLDRDRILECCRMAALDFIGDLPEGIDSILGDRGARLSGGQIQRVAIARALYGNPDLIIFDEATSALDLKNEKSIHETILSLRRSVTVVVIAHRLSTVEGCDNLVWMDSGTVRRAGKVGEILPEYRAAMGRETTHLGNEA